MHLMGSFEHNGGSLVYVVSLRVNMHCPCEKDYYNSLKYLFDDERISCGGYDASPSELFCS
jgi:hypothetical protein